jgi:tetratricopeptide (TPR) repeat protein
MPSATKTLNPAELQKLEHAFATDPTSEAYKPLAEAYLGMGRYMEAMVVCRKGVKAHPTVATPRVLLARVYAEQGKDKKAREELQGALQVSPEDKIALRLMGALQVKGGEGDAGKSNLLKAYEVDQKDEETLELMQKHGVEVPKPAAVAPPPPSTGRGNSSKGARRFEPAPSHISLPDITAASATDLRAPGSRAAPAGSATSRAQSGSSRAAPTRRPKTEQYDWREEETELSEPRPAQKKGSSKALFYLLIFAVPIAAAAYFGLGQYRAKHIRDANKALRDATDRLKADTYASYQQAITAAEEALNLDGSSDTNRNARGLLAYAYTIRWGEHQRDETNRERAQEYLKAGLEGREPSSMLHAAEALFAFYSGKGADGLKAIEPRIKAAEADKKSVSLYYLTRGIIQMNGGDLESAKESLERAQNIAPDDPRIYAALGNLHRRRGTDEKALVAFNNALKYTRNSHPDSLLGTANLILDQDNPGDGYITAARYVKTLLEMEPPPAPRQLAQAHFVRALLVSRVSRDLPQFTNRDFQKKLEEGTRVGTDAARARAEVQKEENDGFALDQKNPELLLIRGRRLAWEEKFDEAAAELKKAIEMNNQASNFHVELAKVLMKKEGGEGQAEEALKRALSLVPNSPKLLAMLGQAQFRQKKGEEARQTLERATSDAKTRNPEARFLLGRIYRDEKRDYERAAGLFEKAAQEYFSDPSMAAASYDELGQTAELKNDRDRARVGYEKALNADKDYAPAYCHYGRFLQRLNDARERDKVRAVASRYLELDPRGECALEMQRMGGVGPPSSLAQ